MKLWKKILVDNFKLDERLLDTIQIRILSEDKIKQYSRHILKSNKGKISLTMEKGYII